MKRTLILFWLILCTAAILPTPARADGGGWPTATPTVTPTSLPTDTPPAPTATVATPTSATAYPPANTEGGAMITPPALAPLPTNTSVDTEGQVSSAKTENALSLAGGIACWPIAIVALLAGIGVLSWLRSAGHKKP